MRNEFIPTLMCDFYKISHRIQYPQGTTLVYSNLTARNDKYNQCAKSKFYDKKFTWFGLRYFLINLQEMFTKNFFEKDLQDCLNEYSRVIKYCLNDNNPDCTHIKALHELGYLPLEIKALPELSRVNFGIPVLTIKNTLPEFFWLTNFIETWLSCDLWQLSNSASIAYEYKNICTEYANKTCNNDEHVKFQCHDFSFRGMSSHQSAMMSGMGHLTSFNGTDTIPAILGMEKYYNKNIENELVGCSIPASEHSVMASGGKDTELETYRRFITELYPNGLVSIVSDTWDFWAVLTDILPQLKDEIMARDGKVVIRPDSGDPVDIICGLNTYDDNFDAYCAYEKSIFINKEDHKIYLINWIGVDQHIDNHGSEYLSDEMDYLVNEYKEFNVYAIKGAIEILWDIFGGTINEKGYKVLDSHIGLIYGDSITIERCQEILDRLEQKGFASSNVVFGVGSYTYQYNTRDSMGWAVKATYCEINGKGINIFKEPKTDSGKKSAKGLLRVEKSSGEYVLLQEQITDDGGELKTVFIDGKLSK